MASRGFLIVFAATLLCVAAGCPARTEQEPAQSAAGSHEATTMEVCDNLVDRLERFGLHPTVADSAGGCLIAGKASLDSLKLEEDPLESLRDSLTASGWTEALEFDADGPGTSSYRVVKEALYCQVYGGAPAWIDDDDEIRQSNDYFIRVMCRKDS